jgi:hypothetical protein
MSNLSLPSRDSDAGPDTRKCPATQRWQSLCEDLAFQFSDLGDQHPEAALVILREAKAMVAQIEAELSTAPAIDKPDWSDLIQEGEAYGQRARRFDSDDVDIERKHREDLINRGIQCFAMSLERLP